MIATVKHLTILSLSFFFLFSLTSCQKNQSDIQKTSELFSSNSFLDVNQSSWKGSRRFFYILHQYEAASVVRRNIYFKDAHESILKKSLDNNLENDLDYFKKLRKPFASTDPSLLYNGLSTDTEKAQAMIKNLKIVLSDKIDYFFIVDYTHKNELSEIYLAAFLHTSISFLKNQKKTNGIWIYAEDDSGCDLVFRKYSKNISEITRVDQTRLLDQLKKNGILLIHKNKDLMHSFNRFASTSIAAHRQSSEWLKKLIEHYRSFLSS